MSIFGGNGNMDESVINLESWNDTTKRFEEDLNELIRYNSKATFPCRGYENTSVVAKKLFEHTSKEILIFDNLFNGFVSNYEQFVLTVDKFCHQQKEISLIIDGNYNEEFVALGEIKKYLYSHRDKGSIRVANDSVRDFIKREFKENYYSFAVADDNKYRLEIDKDRNESVSSFDDEPKSLKLKNIFKKALELSNPIF